MMDLESPVRDPFAVACPRCGAGLWTGCHTVSETGLWACRTHVARWKAIGIAKPTDCDRHNAYVLGHHYHTDALYKFHERMRKGEFT